MVIGTYYSVEIDEGGNMYAVGKMTGVRNEEFVTIQYFNSEPPHIQKHASLQVRLGGNLF